MMSLMRAPAHAGFGTPDATIRQRTSVRNRFSMEAAHTSFGCTSLTRQRKASRAPQACSPATPCTILLEWPEDVHDLAQPAIILIGGLLTPPLITDRKVGDVLRLDHVARANILRPDDAAYMERALFLGDNTPAESFDHQVPIGHDVHDQDRHLIGEATVDRVVGRAV